MKRARLLSLLPFAGLALAVLLLPIPFAATPVTHQVTMTADQFAFDPPVTLAVDLAIGLQLRDSLMQPLNLGSFFGECHRKFAVALPRLDRVVPGANLPELECDPDEYPDTRDRDHYEYLTATDESVPVDTISPSAAPSGTHEPHSSSHQRGRGGPPSGKSIGASSSSICT